MTEYYNDGTVRTHTEIEDYREEIEKIAEDEKELIGFIKFFMNKVYDDIEYIEDWNKDNWVNVIDSNHLQDEMATIYADDKFKDITTVSEIIEMQGLDYEEQQRYVLDREWTQDTFIEYYITNGNIDDLVYDWNNSQGLDDDDDDDDDDDGF